MGTYKINSKYSLILKSNNKLLCISDNNIYYYIVEENEKEEVMTILKSELFQSQNSKIFCLAGLFVFGRVLCLLYKKRELPVR